MLVRILTFSCQYKFCFITFRIPGGCTWCFLPPQSACYLLAGCHYLFWSMSFEYIIHSDYWPKYHFQHSPSVWRSVNPSLWLSLCLCFIKIPLLSLQCSLQFSPKIPGKSIQSPGGWFLFQHTPSHLRCHLIDSEQRKQLSASGSATQLYLSSKIHPEFLVRVRAGSFSQTVVRDCMKMGVTSHFGYSPWPFPPFRNATLLLAYQNR